MRAYLINRLGHLGKNQTDLHSLTNQELLDMLNQHLYYSGAAMWTEGERMRYDAINHDSSYKKGSSHGTSDQS